MKNLNKFHYCAAFFLLFLFYGSLYSQTITLRHTPGYCNRVTASVTDYVKPKLLERLQNVTCGTVSRPLGGNPLPNFRYQLQKLVNGVWVNDGAYRESFDAAFTYRDLVYGQTYRVTVLVRFPGVPLYSYANPCYAPIGSSYVDFSGSTYPSNPLQIVRYQQFTNANMSGVILDNGMQNKGGNGSTYATRKKYCIGEVTAAGDILLNISNTFGADHWVINLTRTNLSGGWAQGEWHDYELPSDFSPIGIFSEGWFDAFGSNSLWPGEYKVTIMGWNDCANSPWAINEDYFEILPIGQGGCRGGINEEELDFTLYPNPVSQGQVEYFTVGKWEDSVVEYTIVAQNGQVQSKGRILDNTGTIDVSSLQSGLYFVTFQSGQGTITKRISVIK